MTQSSDSPPPSVRWANKSLSARMAEQATRISDLRREVRHLRDQNAAVYTALRLILMGRWRGEMPHAEAFVKSLNPEEQEVWEAVEFPSPNPTDLPVLLNSQGQDIYPLLKRTADNAGIPVELLYAGILAESGDPPNPGAERWGRETTAARVAIASEDWDALQAIVDRTWPDISFGYAQRIVAHHWAGNRQATVENCMAVRGTVFANSDRDMGEMADLLRSNLDLAREQDLSRVKRDIWLAALVMYNAGHYPTDPAWWERWEGNVESYRLALRRAVARSS